MRGLAARFQGVANFRSKRGMLVEQGVNRRVGKDENLEVAFGHDGDVLSGAACGGLLLRALGEDRNAYYAVFVVSAILRVAAIPLLRRVHLPQQPSANATR